MLISTGNLDILNREDFGIGHMDDMLELLNKYSL